MKIFPISNSSVDEQKSSTFNTTRMKNLHGRITQQRSILNFELANKQKQAHERHESGIIKNNQLTDKQLRYLFELLEDFNLNFSQVSLLKIVKKIFSSHLNVDSLIFMLKERDSGEYSIAAASGVNVTSLLQQPLKFEINKTTYCPNLQRRTIQSFSKIFPVRGSLLIEPIYNATHEESAGYLVLHRNEIDSFSVSERFFIENLLLHLGNMLGRISEFHQIQTQSITDSLTQIPNRRYFDKQLELEIERARRYDHPLTILMIDIDYFKKYNDKFGHQYGDIALKRVVQCLGALLREGDFLARYGGEEFMVILPETNKKQGLQVAEKLRLAVQSSTFNGLKEAYAHELTISLGIASLPEDATDSAELIGMVDNALYWAKSHGRNRTADFAHIQEETEIREANMAVL
ncbi:GGDEF domain-containing protein [candidate division KSB1 bacterium]|nr:GGDEF domain-containing protein [candidate division KSB1 bacterium]